MEDKQTLEYLILRQQHQIRRWRGQKEIIDAILKEDLEHLHALKRDLHALERAMKADTAVAPQDGITSSEVS